MLYASPRVSANSAGAKDPGGKASSYDVSARYITRRASGKVRICVDLVSGGCGY